MFLVRVGVLGQVADNPQDKNRVLWAQYSVTIHLEPNLAGLFSIDGLYSPVFL